MYNSVKQRIVFIGSGRLAGSAAKALSTAGHTIVQVYSPTLAHAELLAKEVNAGYTDKAEKVSTDVDCYIVAVNDSAIEKVLSSVDFAGQLVVHTSGATSIDIFGTKVSRYGVFYPLQTFSMGRDVNFEQVPMLIEGSSPEVTEQLLALANSISTRVFAVSSENRLRLHVAGTFACNFVNHLLAISDTLVQEAGLDFSLLSELINETIQKALSVAHPAQVQTGPAVRNDSITINKHLALLATHPDWQGLYQQLTESIVKHE